MYKLYPDACDAGSYRDSSMTTCEKCPAGQYSETPGSGMCFQCPANTAANVDQTKCGKIVKAMLVSSSKLGKLAMDGFYQKLSRPQSQNLSLCFSFEDIYIVVKFAHHLRFQDQQLT